ncbi:MAG TPA: hypothetical protein VGV93_03295 [Acidimicrobiales bacterium]|nr:hypothetical protein [Acidimicrobiales bacterium]
MAASVQFFGRLRSGSHGRRHDLAHGAYVDPAGGRRLFRDYAEQWRTAQVHRPTTAASVETSLRLHAYPKFGGRPIGSIRRSEIQAWVKGLTGVLASATVELATAGCRRSSKPRSATG